MTHFKNILMFMEQNQLVIKINKKAHINQHIFPNNIHCL